MVLEIADQYIKNTHLYNCNLKLEFAVYLFKENILTLEQASKLADYTYLNFLQELGNRNINIHYDDEELDRDLKNIQTLKLS